MERERLETICAALPIFPLPRMVLMPRDALPLHVFEPRYRALVAHCVAHDGVMGLATLRPGYEADYDGAPAIHAEIGVGRIAVHQRLPDGRSNLVLEAIGRAQLVEELPSPHPFRLVRAALRQDVEDAPQLSGLRALVRQLGSFSEAAAAEAARVAALPGAELLDDLARRMLEDPDDRRAWLTLDRHSARASLIEGRLASLVPRDRGAGEA